MLFFKETEMSGFFFNERVRYIWRMELKSINSIRLWLVPMFVFYFSVHVSDLNLKFQMALCMALHGTVWSLYSHFRFIELLLNWLCWIYWKIKTFCSVCVCVYIKLHNVFASFSSHTHIYGMIRFYLNEI